MSLLDDILKRLTDSGPADAATLAELLGRDPAVVARMLGKLRADGRVAVDDSGIARAAGARRKNPPPPRSTRHPSRSPRSSTSPRRPCAAGSTPTAASASGGAARSRSRCGSSRRARNGGQHERPESSGRACVDEAAPIPVRTGRPRKRVHARQRRAVDVRPLRRHRRPGVAKTTDDCTRCGHAAIERVPGADHHLCAEPKEREQRQKAERDGGEAGR